MGILALVTCKLGTSGFGSASMVEQVTYAAGLTVIVTGASRWMMYGDANGSWRGKKTAATTRSNPFPIGDLMLIRRLRKMARHLNIRRRRRKKMHLSMAQRRRCCRWCTSWPEARGAGRRWCTSWLEARGARWRWIGGAGVCVRASWLDRRREEHMRLF